MIRELLARLFRSSDEGPVRHVSYGVIKDRDASLTYCGCEVVGRHPAGTEVGEGRPCRHCSVVVDAW